jgi:hypothetical protein
MGIDKGFWADRGQWPDDIHENTSTGAQLTFISLARVLSDARLRRGTDSSAVNDSAVAPDDFIETSRSIVQWCEASKPPLAMDDLKPKYRAVLSCAAFMWPLDASLWLMDRDLWRGSAWQA